MTNEPQSGKMASDIYVLTNQSCVFEFLHAEKIELSENHRSMLNVFGDQTLDLSTDGGSCVSAIPIMVFLTRHVYQCGIYALLMKSHISYLEKTCSIQHYCAAWIRCCFRGNN